MSQNKTLPVIGDFLSYLLDERAFSPYTAKCYGVDLRQFVEFLTEENNITLDLQDETAAWKRCGDADSTGVAGTVGPDCLTNHILKADTSLVREYLAHLDSFDYSAATNGQEDRHHAILLQMARKAWHHPGQSNGADPDTPSGQASA